MGHLPGLTGAQEDRAPRHRGPLDRDPAVLKKRPAWYRNAQELFAAAKPTAAIPTIRKMKEVMGILTMYHRTRLISTPGADLYSAALNLKR